MTPRRPVGLEAKDLDFLRRAGAAIGTPPFLNVVFCMQNSISNGRRPVNNKNQRQQPYRSAFPSRPDVPLKRQVGLGAMPAATSAQIDPMFERCLLGEMRNRARSRRGCGRSGRGGQDRRRQVESSRQPELTAPRTVRTVFGRIKQSPLSMSAGEGCLFYGFPVNAEWDIKILGWSILSGFINDQMDAPVSWSGAGLSHPEWWY